MRRSLEEKEREEKKLLIQVLREENGGDIDLTRIDYELIQSSLAIMKTFSLIPQNKRGRRMMLSDHLDNVIELSMAKERALGYVVSPIEININDIEKIIYGFDFKYSKSKGKESNKRIHIDNYSVTAMDEESALLVLKQRLKKLKETLVEMKGVKRRHSSYLLKNGESVLAENVVNIITN